MSTSMEVFNKLEGKVKGMKGFLVILLPWYLLVIVVNLRRDQTAVTVPPFIRAAP
jgi:hypothetical protein